MIRSVVLVGLSLSLLCSLFLDIHGWRNVSVVKLTILRCVIGLALCNFMSLQRQIIGLVGIRGISPADKTLSKISVEKIQLGKSSIFSFNFLRFGLLTFTHWRYYNPKCQDEGLMNEITIVTIVALLALLSPNPFLMGYLFLSHFALKQIVVHFMDFQMDNLLLETLFTSFLLSMAQDKFAVVLGLWQLKVLLFRVMVSSGMTKYFGRQGFWNGQYTAMSHYFLTQPLPNRLAMYLHCYLPRFCFRPLTVLLLVSELLLPFLTLLSVPVLNTVLAAWFVALFMFREATGNHGVLCLLLATLCLSLVSDDCMPLAMQLMSPPYGLSLDLHAPSGLGVWSARLHHAVHCSGTKECVMAWSTLLVSVCSSIVLTLVTYVPHLFVFAAQLADVYGTVRKTRLVSTISTYLSVVSDTHDEHSIKPGNGFCAASWPLRMLSKLHSGMATTLCVGCHYGLFAHATRVRNELIIEVSDDAEVWQSLEPRFRPGSSYLSPKTVAPFFHLPRLDWSMWVLAQHSGSDLPRWFWVLLISLLEGNREVLRLLHPHSTAVIQSMCDTYLHRSVAGSTDERKPYRWVRVRLDNYTFTCQHRAKRQRGGVAAVQYEKGSTWTVMPLEEVQAPVTAEELRDALDRQDLLREKELASREALSGHLGHSGASRSANMTGGEVEGEEGVGQELQQAMLSILTPCSWEEEHQESTSALHEQE